MNLSKTLIHAFDEAETSSEGCMLKFKYEFVDKLPEFQDPYVPKSAAGKGNYFEFLVTGAKLRDGTEPFPEVLKSGKMSADYERIKKAAELCKKMLDYYKIKIIDLDLKLEYKHNKQNVKGILDILAEWNGKNVIIDLKLSGLIGNKWEKYGWHPENVEFHKLQARIYKWLYYKKYGKEIPFYYLVFSPKNQDKLFWEMKHEDFEADIENLEKKFDYITEMINFHNDMGYKPTDNYMVCKDCPAKDCENRIYFPKVREIYM